MMNKKINGILLLCVFLLFNCHSTPPEPQSILKSSYKNRVSVHDPSVIKAEDAYYIFGSHMAAAKSYNLWDWEMIAEGANKYNRLFDNLFTDMKAFDYVGRNSQGSYSVWAPDVIYNKEMEKYVMYFCTSSTYIKSNLCYATADTVEGPYIYRETFLYSGFTRTTIDETNVLDIIGDENPRKYYKSTRYDNFKWPNCIDPALFYDKDNRMWMTYGSWSGGIFILEIDTQTGLPVHPETDKDTGTDSYFGRHLLGGLHNSVEGPYIIYDDISGYYYLFVSYGGLESNGGYQIRLYRSGNPDGPYADASGKGFGAVAGHSQLGVKMMGNYLLPSLLLAYMAPGHMSAMIDEDGKILLFYHVRFDDGTEYHEPRVHQLFRNVHNWLVAAPFNYNGETISVTGYPENELVGYYYLVNHGLDISAGIHSGEFIRLTSRGLVLSDKGKKTGAWNRTVDSCYMSIILDGVTYDGVFLKQKDEGRNEVMTFSAVARNNETVWGVKY